MNKKNNNYYFLIYFLFFMVVIFPVISQTSTDTNFQLIPGQRSLPDRVPRDEYVYIPEEETNDPSPNLNIHSLPPQSNFDIPPRNYKS